MALLQTLLEKRGIKSEKPLKFAKLCSNKF